MMANKSKSKNARRWTENSFVLSMEILARKKSSNNEVFEHIQSQFLSEMESEDFKFRNAIHFKGKKPAKLDNSIERYKLLKLEWSAKTTRAKNGSELDLDEEPDWYKVLNPVFAETHEPLNLVSNMDTSFVYELSQSDDEDASGATRSG